MNQQERLEEIMAYLRVNKKICVEDICRLYGISRDSARRDLVKLEVSRQILRVHGGAILPHEVPFVDRYEQREQRDLKRNIGRVAASLIGDGESILLDTSTTVQMAAEAIKAKNIFAVTNSMDIAAILGKRETYKVHLLGGEFDAWQRSVTGIQTIEMLQKFQVQTLFLGICGFSETGLSSPSLEEAYLKKEMIRQADRVVALVDHSKLQKKFLHHICNLESIDILISDEVPPALQDILKQIGVQIIIAKDDEKYEI